MEKLHTFLFTSKGKILENAKSLGMLLSKRWTICMPAEHEMDCQCIFILNPLLNLKNKSIYFILIHLYSLFSFPSLFPSCPPFSSTLFILPTVCTRDSIVRIQHIFTMSIAVSPVASEAVSPMITSVTPTLESSSKQGPCGPNESGVLQSPEHRLRNQKPPPLHTGADWKVVLHLPEIETWLRATAERVRDLTQSVQQDSLNRHVDVHLVQLKVRDTVARCNLHADVHEVC